MSALGGRRVVALGGGHGLASTLRALRGLGASVTAIVSVADDGGSSGRLRASTGLPAPGDLRRCLVAMADPESLWSRAFEHRFTGGELDGHALGNLVIAGLAEVTGDFAAALGAAASLLGASGRVIPATSVPVALKAVVGGSEVLGQVAVGGTLEAITSVSVVPPDAPSSREVGDAVAAADLVVIGPGSLYTSVLATCVVPAVRDALEARTCGTVYVCNLRPQVPETDGYSPADHLRAVLAHGVRPQFAVVDAGYPSGPGGALAEECAAAGVELIVEPLARADRGAHDPDALGSVLARLACEPGGRSGERAGADEE